MRKYFGTIAFALALTAGLAPRASADDLFQPERANLAVFKDASPLVEGNVVKAAGMTEHVDFHDQVTVDGGDDGRFRPDMTVHLPTDRDITIITNADATSLKPVANSWVIAASNATGEALALAKALGVDPQGFFDIIGGGPLDMGYLHAKAELILQNRLTPASFAVDTAAKDARLIVQAAQQHGIHLDIAEAGAQRLARAGAQGHGDEDMAAAYYASFEEH